MKRLILGFAACALVMSSCTQQEITENVTDGQGQLSFSTGLGKQSARAAELMNIALQDAANSENDGIALRAYQETETAGTYEKWFFDNLWYEGSVWKIASTRFRNTYNTKYITYFPKSTKLVEIPDAFETATFVDGTGVFPAFTYTVAPNAGQEDLIAGVTNVEKNKSNITLAMRHILSQVNFGTVGYTGANIAIRNIKIEGLYNSAIFTYKAADTYPIGAWTGHKVAGGAESDRNVAYEYYNKSNTADGVGLNAQLIVPATAEKGDTYIYGDGGNAGPGRGNTKWYPIGPGNTWTHADATESTRLTNSLILLPQNFVGVPTAKVTFEFRITDVDGAFIEGTQTTWEKGEFQLDFSKGGTSGTDYMSAWESNFRYVYLIDFTDLLDGNALTFKVDVEALPWENHDNDGDDNGEVIVTVAGQPTPTAMNATTFEAGNTWYIATQSETSPKDQEWAQVVRTETWNMSDYDFTQIGVGQTFILNFENVIFNTSATPTPGNDTNITLTLPAGYTAVKGAGITMTGNAPTYTISLGKKSADATITITNSNTEYSTPATLLAAIEAVTVSGTTLVYKGSLAVNLTTMEPVLTVAGYKMAVTMNKVTPTLGATDNGVWTWNASTRTATWTRN